MRYGKVPYEVFSWRMLTRIGSELREVVEFWHISAAL